MADGNTNTVETGDATKLPVRLLTRDEMPGDYAISLDNYVRGGTDQFLTAQDPNMPRQSMRGFDPTYRNIVDYIVRITHRIWEEKDIGYIYDTYRHDCSVWDDFGLQFGRDKIVADTVHTNNAIPDIRLVADEVIWAGNDEVGFRTSHRAVMIGHNTGWSRFGPPTNRRVRYWCIANCVVRDNEIFLEHVLYNTSSLLQQLGLNLFDFAQGISRGQSAGTPPRDFSSSEPRRLIGQGKPLYIPFETGMAQDIEDFVRCFYQNVWNRRMLSTIDRMCAPNILLHAVTDREYQGVGHYRHFVLSMLAMFPDLAMSVDEVYWMGNAREGYRVSIRWSAEAAHRGHGVYGAPTQRGVHLWGISQWLVRDGLIREEWLQMNELSVLTQILGDE